MSEKKTVWETLSKKEREAAFSVSEEYKAFLNQGKTEREFQKTAVSYLKEKGFRPLSSYKALKPGDKVYAENRKKGLIAAVMGKNMEEGLRIVGAHIDSPRLDLKQNPLYEEESLALFKTHYYGGVKKYQWTAIPLALHGVVMKKDGTATEIAIGEEGDNVTFAISDLLPHLATAQMGKKLSQAIEGEALNILCGSLPGEDEKDPVKGAIKKLLLERYGIEEEDFACAELEAVPAFSAKDVGFDQGLVGGYGQDDRVCAFCTLKAIGEVVDPSMTAICLLVDKEEIGSMGNTGMQSRFFEDTMAYLAEKTGTYSDLALRRAFGKSACLSADVTAGLDPTYPSVQEKLNATRLGYGTAIAKFTGSRGKAGSSDAHAEFLAYVRRVFDAKKVAWQTGELGKVDEGGGGTIAQFMANLNIDTLDCGVALLSMHSPYEIASKSDIYMTYLGYRAFMESDGYWYEA